MAAHLDAHEAAHEAALVAILANPVEGEVCFLCSFSSNGTKCGG